MNAPLEVPFQVSSTIDRNTKSKVLKILEDDAIFGLTTKIIGSRFIYLIIQKYLEYIRF